MEARTMSDKRQVWRYTLPRCGAMVGRTKSGNRQLCNRPSVSAWTWNYGKHSTTRYFCEEHDAETRKRVADVQCSVFRPHIE
jgi:hypothetical protein